MKGDGRGLTGDGMGVKEDGREVPPNIVDGESSGDVKVEEGANITLECGATGTPPPTITWRRETRTNININATTHVVEQEGESLHLARVTRHDMDHYLCIASNGVPPMVSKRINVEVECEYCGDKRETETECEGLNKVKVEFPPLLSVGNQLVGVPVGYNVELDCTVEAHPTALTYWTTGRGIMLHHGNKYQIKETPQNKELPYRTNMKLTIANITQEDYGNYKCVTKNSKGETDGKISLYGKDESPTTQPIKTAPPTSAPTTAPSQHEEVLKDSRHHHQAPNSVMRGGTNNQEGGEVQLVTAGGGGGGGDPKEKNDVIQLEERQKWEDGSGAGEGRGRHTQHDGSTAVSFSSTAVTG
ncbi:hypothetical protein Pcinc_005276 [Petrolisthes cinctipes]|uniref:Ig-like domain-containing protein n=1 Tax=Petrolisthes cinctipes TaxID=88211 RepID=A0AAE1GD27_PETCI|nr:hypothetical protein Pcinc_005276 [Petrolisthes cinctipes]